MLMQHMRALCILIACFAFHSNASAKQTLNLVGNIVATYIDNHGQSARQIELVNTILTDYPHNITATTQAWSGSGLRSGKFQGYIDHYSLNQNDDDYLYSKPYMQYELYIASQYERVKTYSRLEQIARTRVGIENRFANTDMVRGDRLVSWARAPSFYDNIKQLAEGRVDYIVADKAMIEEFNKLLKSIDEEPIHFSKAPVYVVDVTMGIARSFSEANAVLAVFNQSLGKIQQSGKVASILQPDEAESSLLDESIYMDILRKW